MTRARLLRHVAALVFVAVTAVTYPPRVQADSCTELMALSCSHMTIYWGIAFFSFSCEFPNDCYWSEQCCQQFCGSEPDDFSCEEDAIGPHGYCDCEV